MDCTNVALLPSGQIDNEAFYDNLHLNNEKRVANTCKQHQDISWFEVKTRAKIAKTLYK